MNKRKNDVLISARIKLELTQEDMAELLHINPSSYSRYESLKIYPPKEIQKVIISYFSERGVNLSEEDLFSKKLYEKSSNSNEESSLEKNIGLVNTREQLGFSRGRLAEQLHINSVIYGNYENLKVWQKAVELAVSIYRITNEKDLFRRDLGLKDQIRRASVSISSNISEGDELGTDKQAIRQFYIAKGSVAELYTQLTISGKIGYISDEENLCLREECKHISAMLMNLIKSRSASI